MKRRLSVAAETEKIMVKKWLSYIFPCILVPAAVLLGATVFKDKQYAWISLCVAVLSCVPFFLAFEKGKSGTKEMILIAVMVALSAVGRLFFRWQPAENRLRDPLL